MRIIVFQRSISTAYLTGKYNQSSRLNYTPRNHLLHFRGMYVCYMSKFLYNCDVGSRFLPFLQSCFHVKFSLLLICDDEEEVMLSIMSDSWQWARSPHFSFLFIVLAYHKSETSSKFNEQSPQIFEMHNSIKGTFCVDVRLYMKES